MKPSVSFENIAIIIRIKKSLGSLINPRAIFEPISMPLSSHYTIINNNVHGKWPLKLL